MSKVPHILIVEDSDDDADLLQRSLMRSGLEATYRRVDTAAGVSDALQNERFNIVLSDFNLPQHDFSDIRQAINEIDPDLPVIVISGSIGEENAVALMREGVADFILKGNTSRLIPAIQRELAAAGQQAARRDSEQRFRDIVEVSGDWIWETDAEHRYTFFSNKLSDADWADPAQCLGKTCWELAGGSIDEDEHWRNFIAELNAHRPFRNFLMRFNTPAGNRHISMSGLPVFDRDGAFRGYRGTATDETPVVEAFWRAEEAEALLRDAVETISEGFIIFDADDRIETVNEAYRRLFPEIPDVLVPGTRHEDLMRTAVERDVFPEAVGREQQWLEETQSHHRNLSGTRVCRLTGGRWALVSERRMSNGGIAGLTMDITALKTAQEELDHLASHDGLTGLPNQTLFAGRVAQALHQVERAGGVVAVVCLELASLNDIRDSHGIESGDAAIKEVGRRLSKAASDAVAHIGGGQFLLLLSRMSNGTDIMAAAETLLKDFEQDFRYENATIPLRIAAGVSIAPTDANEAEALIRNATTAMHRSKDGPTRRFQFYSAEMTNVAIARSTIESELRRAIDNDELFLVYQPLVDSHTYDLVGAEALARWRHPDRGVVAPGEFIPIAEQTGLIIPMGNYLLRRACMQARAWLDAGKPSRPISVNLSALQLAHQGLEEATFAILEETGVPRGAINLELTESSILRDVETATRTMRNFAEHGIKFAVDDFGMEHSALSHLSTLPIDTLKIDRSFLVKMTEDRAHAALFQAIVAMAHSLGMTALAEGVETAAQLVYLQAYGCDTAQGFFFSPPLEVESYERLLELGKVAPKDDTTAEERLAMRPLRPSTAA